MYLSALFILISGFSIWAVISRPDRWAGASTYHQAIYSVFISFIHARTAPPKDLARFRYLNLMCLASSSFALAVANTLQIVAPNPHAQLTLDFVHGWFTLTVISLTVGIALGPPLKS